MATAVINALQFIWLSTLPAHLFLMLKRETLLWNSLLEYNQCGTTAVTVFYGVCVCYIAIGFAWEHNVLFFWCTLSRYMTHVRCEPLFFWLMLISRSMQNGCSMFLKILELCNNANKKLQYCNIAILKQMRWYIHILVCNMKSAYFIVVIPLYWAFQGMILFLFSSMIQPQFPRSSGYFSRRQY